MEIKFNHVNFCYQKINCRCKEVFEDINLDFSSSNIYGIVGQNGSGKTTLLKMIYGTSLPTNGEIKVGDFKILSDEKIKNVNELRSNIGVVFQDSEEQFFAKTIYEELAFNIMSYKPRTTDIDKRVIDALKMVGFDSSYLMKNPIHLSKGEMRKLAFADALVHNPKILLLDDPTIGLDARGKDSLIKLLRMLKNRYHKTIIIASNDTDFLHSIVDNVVVLYDKQVVMSGNKYDVFKEVKKLKEYGVTPPKLIQFSHKVLEKKKVKLGYRDEINDLIKDIYRCSR